ncbi:MAG: tetratricopeptide repeat protein, partial [Pseudomonadota bacterium]
PFAAAPVQGGQPSRDEDREIQRERDMMLTQQALNAQKMATAQAGSPKPAPGPDTLAPLAAPDSSDIKVARSSVPTQTDPTLQNAYQAFNGGDLPRAQQQYEAALRADPNNRDALLGTAAVALRQNQQQQAAAVYNRLLDLDPNDADALAGLMGLRQGDASQAELRLKSILNRTPDAAPVQFALGNLYARQGRWPEAQQAYFRAWSAAPGNADYAYNLAIGLDRLNQGKLALTYYQKALALAQDGPVGFDRAVLRQRMHQLANPGQQ